MDKIEKILTVVSSVVDEIVPIAKLRERNAQQFEDGLSFVKVNNLFDSLVNNTSINISEENYEYRHLLIELDKYLNEWKENWKNKGLDIDITINSIKRIWS